MSSAACGQDDAEEDDSPFRPGLIARYIAPGGQTASRVDEAMAFAWQDAPPDPRLPAGAFAATWQGRILTQAPGDYRLQVYAGGGRVRLKLAGKEVLADTAEGPQWLRSGPVTLPFGHHPLEVSFERTGPSAQLALFWSGPNFVLEPVPERFLVHERERSPGAEFERGRRLARALRCDVCHAEGDRSQPLPAPALDRLSGNIQTPWLIDWLSGAAAGPREGEEGEAPGQPRLVRRMPHFALTQKEAADVAAWLVRLPPEKRPESGTRQIEPKAAKGAKGGKNKGKLAPTKPSADEGQRLFLTLGCLACHQRGDLGESGLFGGGDLTAIAAKRPAEFFSHWLADPASLNRHHRMPVFDLRPLERESLALWLAEQNGALRSAVPGAANAALPTGDAARGERLVSSLRCGSCHALPGIETTPKPSNLKALTSSSDWSRSCAGQPEVKASRPGYRLASADQAALKAFYASRLTPQDSAQDSPPSMGRDLLVELNCLACHAREGIDRAANALPARLQDKLRAVVDLHDDLGKLVPAMTPPALNGVGDKLHDAALAAAIRRQDKPHRPYLQVQMPKFNLTDQQLDSLVAFFTTTDRIPALNPKSGIRNPKFLAAGPRLVTTDGFGCTSCHQVGGVLPDKAPLNARGPDLSMLSKRIRREWFHRWCYSPARIVPRMEMPSVQVPVRGVLGENVHDQLAAVWHILNTPGFQPPEPNPVRVLRLSGVPERNEKPIVLHDVIKAGEKTYLFPLVIGLPNRHNLLFDLETNRLAAWWLGDTARQRTKGKTWFWEQAGESICNPGIDGTDLSLVSDGKLYAPRPAPQFAATVDYLNRNGTEGVTFHRNVEFKIPDSNGQLRSVTVRVFEVVRRLDSAPRESTGFSRDVGITGIPTGFQARLRIVSQEVLRNSTPEDNGKTLRLPGPGRCRIRFHAPASFKWRSDGSFDVDSEAGIESFPNEYLSVAYRTELPVDRYLAGVPPAIPIAPDVVQIAPGLAGQRLPLPGDVMPSALTWKSDGRMVFATLKGQVFDAKDSDRDGLEDSLRLLEDGLATPYGLATDADSVEVVDVLTKSGLVRLVEVDDVGIADRNHLLASGWGVTDDYHDWAVGLIQGGKGEYYLGLPCQQDQRSEAAAKHRGQVLKLVPRSATPENPRLFDIEVVSSGHRFSMGLARNREGALFVTDNQGNYNPFNELNHVRPGAHFGFINALEKERGYKPPQLDKPAIDIPHPWTRSVNGICFLETPPALLAGSALAERADRIFGPLEGHLIGCEYDTRALIRMTLQKVGDTYQGAAYPLSIPPRNVEDGLLGPIVCAVSPRGELYVGNIRDSGWGAGNNIGDIVQIKIEPEKLPCGIAEVRATGDGFTLDFFRPVDPAKARDAANYSLASYRRESTPAYGGPNLDRRVEKIAAIDLSPDSNRVTLKLDDLREGFLYEFQLRPLSPGKEPFHPAEAHYTLSRIPD